MPTDHVSYVEDTLWVAVEPTLNRLTTSPIQASRGLPTRQMPTDHVSYAEDTIRLAGKPSMNRLTESPIQVCRACPAIASRRRNLPADSMGRQVWTRDYNRTDGQDAVTVDTAKVYDSLGRVVEEAISVAGGTSQTVTYAYDGSAGADRPCELCRGHHSGSGKAYSEPLHPKPHSGLPGPPGSADAD